MIVGLRAAIITTTTARIAASTRVLSTLPTNSLWLQLPRRRQSSSSVFRSNQSYSAATIGRNNINRDPPLVVRDCTINSSYYPSPLLSTQQKQQTTTRSRRTIMSTASSAGGVEYLCGTYSIYIYIYIYIYIPQTRCCFSLLGVASCRRIFVRNNKKRLIMAHRSAALLSASVALLFLLLAATIYFLLNIQFTFTSRPSRGRKTRSERLP